MSSSNSNPTCYYRNGTSASSDYVAFMATTPSSPLSSICCNKGAGDRLLDNGLCQSTQDGAFWRELCTHSDWSQGGCQTMCSDSGYGDVTKVTPCDGAANNASSLTWCCGDSGDCCKDGSNLRRFTIAQKFSTSTPTPIPTSSSSSTMHLQSTSSTPSPSNSAVLQQTPPSHGLSTGAKAGIALGALFGFFALIGLCLFILKALQWRKNSKEQTQSRKWNGSSEVYQYQQPVPPVELESEIPEMSGSKYTPELNSPGDETMTEKTADHHQSPASEVSYA